MLCNHGNKLSLRSPRANLQHPDYPSKMAKGEKGSKITPCIGTSSKLTRLWWNQLFWLTWETRELKPTDKSVPAPKGSQTKWQQGTLPRGGTVLCPGGVRGHTHSYTITSIELYLQKGNCTCTFLWKVKQKCYKAMHRNPLKNTWAVFTRKQRDLVKLAHSLVCHPRPLTVLPSSWTSCGTSWGPGVCST